MNFLTELIARFFAKTPKFFRILRTIGVIIAVVTGLPAFLASQGIDLPDSIDIIANKVVAIATMIGAFIAQLTATIEEKKEKELSD